MKDRYEFMLVGGTMREVDRYGMIRRLPYSSFGYKWVFPHQRRTKEEYPYSYSPHFILGDHESTKDCFAEYHDRMQEWNHEKYRKCFEQINGHGKESKGGFTSWNFDQFSEFMTAYFDKLTTCTGVSEEANVSTGYPIWCLYYKAV